MTNWGPIGKEVYERTYSRRKPDGTHETWEETVERVVDGNTALANSIKPVSLEEKNQLKEMIKAFKIMPAGRHLWVSGVPGRQYLFNCHRAGWDEGSPESHCLFLFHELMRGGGVGANYSNSYDYYPNESKIHFYITPTHKDANLLSEVYTNEPKFWTHRVEIEDSQEGWVKALQILIQSHFKNGGHVNLLDFSNIRPKGDLIVGFGGVASGPYDLITMLQEVHELLNKKSASGGSLSPLDLMELDHSIAKCVISGNVRRSARMSIVHWQDPQIMDFIHCKEDPALHWTTNISVELDAKFWSSIHFKDDYALKILKEIAKGMRLNGEPGIFNSHLASEGENGDVRCTNPCGEIALEEWENCNLGHLNLGLLEDREMPLALKLMTRFLMRATLSPDVSERQKPVLERNRRIGVGFYGFQEYLADRWNLSYRQVSSSNITNHVADELKSWKKVVNTETMRYTKALGINSPVKRTTIAPTGTISTLSGHTPGIHPVLAKYFIRRVRYADNNPILNKYPKEMLEKDLVSDNTTIVKFLCEDPILRNVKNPELIQSGDELTVKNQLAVQHLVQQNWADNAVSFTVQLRKWDTHDDIIEALLKYGPVLKGSTMFPPTSIAQAPIETLTEVEFRKQSLDLNAKVSQIEAECTNGSCPIK